MTTSSHWTRCGSSRTRGSEAGGAVTTAAPGRHSDPAVLRAEIRAGRFTATTAGHCPGFAQANLVVLPREAAYDFLVLIGCSFTFEEALLAAGVPVRQIEEGVTVPMYRTHVDCLPAGRFSGPLLVSMRPIPAGAVGRGRARGGGVGPLPGCPRRAGPRRRPGGAGHLRPRRARLGRPRAGPRWRAAVGGVATRARPRGRAGPLRARLLGTARSTAHTGWTLG